MKNNQARAPSPPEQADRGRVQPTATAQDPGLQIAQLTDVGRARPHNEDYVHHFVPTDPQQREAKGSIFLVADGMGGHQAGEVASRHAAEVVIQQYYGDTERDVGSSLVRALRAANRAVHEQAQADPSKTGMGTTMVAAVILGRKVYLANVGDSRAYIISQSGIDQITLDHSWIEEQIRAGLLTAEQARHHPQRNLVTRALGSRPSVEVDLFEGQLGEGASLLLCSDGLTTHVEDWELEAAVRQRPPEEAAQWLIETANRRGGGDNISVLIVTERDMPAPAMAPAVPARPARAIPIVPIVAALAAVLVLVGGGLLVVPSLLKGTATPTPTVLPTTATSELAPTAATTEPVLPTPTGSSPAETPSPGELIGPTATLRSTWTPTPTPTPTATHTATPEPTATETETATATATSTLPSQLPTLRPILPTVVIETPVPATAQP